MTDYTEVKRKVVGKIFAKQMTGKMLFYHTQSSNKLIKETNKQIEQWQNI